MDKSTPLGQLLVKRRSLAGVIAWNSRLDGDPQKADAARLELAAVNAAIQQVLVASGASR